MIRSTTSKLFICLVFTFFAPFLLGSSLIYWHEKQAAIHRLELKLSDIVSDLKRELSEPMAFFFPQEGVKIAQIIVSNYESVAEIYAYSDIYQMPLVHIDVLERRHGRLLSHERDIFWEGSKIGKISVTVTTDKITGKIFSPFLKKVLIIFMCMAVVGFLVMEFAFHRYMVLPMRRLLRQTNNISNGLMDEPFIWQGDDEFAHLGKTIESMREELFVQFSKINLEARTDKLTGISNRRDFLEKVEKILAGSQENNTPFSLIMFDLDDFKKVNDKYGHSVGDQVLHTVSLSLGQNLRKSDLFSRWGGEEFLIALPMTGEENACIIAEVLRKVLASTSYPQLDMVVTASFGVVQARENESFQTMLDKADQALYLAKRRGKNRVVSYHD
ncbi:MAG: hypothetical protein CSB24_01345 [Deltaproteobacteria bacterium]|nr:MAG: hypothetical protein CSB24_01345 [Deltaproteobacteria bacterium]